ncbi:dual specificity protein phosphatase family protein [Sedimenticola hydrogenitrophicus]|uniref:dual specificity protein phosphatase family protein n=1 Tax=Sedimenticola hydrogenitrophicus TaxID=2967975 RepID=UPI0023AEB6B1|nr:dual specificity protein phosphatase family protein [Sedimenticola hydrogenitrophicus]
MDNPKATPTHWEKLFWALGLGGLFFLVYGTTNSLSAELNGLPSLYLPWEERIPFLGWTILPYLSLDIFFILSFFWLRDRRELYGHAGRILLALGISCLLFLLQPMQFGFVRPETSGWVGGLFNLLTLDLPYNQCPSLHVSLSLIYWPLVRRMADGWGRSLLGLWFWLIALSTLTVYQHHFIDLVGGLLVGLLVMHTIPLNDAPGAVVNRQSARMAIRYGAGALAALALALLSRDWEWGWLLLYPILTLALVAGAYAGGRADFLQKRHGRHCLVTRLLFAPYLIGTHLTWRYFRSRVSPWNHLSDGIYFGRRLTASEAARLKQLGVGAVLDLAPETAETKRWGELHYHHAPLLDFATPDRQALQAAVRFIRQHRTGVYIHCSLGLSRCALVAIAYLMSEGMSLESAYRYTREHRSGIVLDDYALGTLIADTANTDMITRKGTAHA